MVYCVFPYSIRRIIHILRHPQSHNLINATVATSESGEWGNYHGHPLVVIDLPQPAESVHWPADFRLVDGHQIDASARVESSSLVTPLCGCSAVVILNVVLDTLLLPPQYLYIKSRIMASFISHLLFPISLPRTISNISSATYDDMSTLLRESLTRYFVVGSISSHPTPLRILLNQSVHSLPHL